MLIVCPNCSTGYDVNPDVLGDSGRTVRCVRCRQTWIAPATATPELVAATSASPGATVGADARDGLAAIPAADSTDEDWNAAPVVNEPVAERAGTTQSQADDEMADVWGVPQQPSPPLAPDGHETSERPAEKPPVDIETLAALQEQKKVERGRFDRFDLSKFRLSTMIKTIIALQVVAIVAIVVWRHEIVGWRPQMASFFSVFGLNVNLRGLDFVDVHTVQDSRDGVVVLIVEGALKNVTNTTVTVPRLRFALRNKELAELYAWTAPPDRGMLGAGETLPFRTRLASPPPDGDDVLVRFLVRQDLVNGSR